MNVPEPQNKGATSSTSEKLEQKQAKREQRKLQRQRQQASYQGAAVAASALVMGIALFATYYRFVFHLPEGAAIPWIDISCTIALIGLGVVGMEMWARWAHKTLWHDFEPGWNLHKSHHVPRVGMFEDNDVFAIINAIPAIALCSYGFFSPGLIGALCFGGGLGITMFGIMYMFVHDGLVHKRFPVGPIENLPYLQRVAVAHKLHHSTKYKGVPYGLFLGPQELEAIGAKSDLDDMVAQVYSNKKDQEKKQQREKVRQ